MLTPEYQKRFVQQMYHYSGSNAAQWPGSYCWPEGFMRRFAQYGGARVSLVMTPELILDIRNAAKTLITQIHIGREFNEEGVVPRLGPDVPQWFGETIGFWDGEALITWTSNIQGWISHGGFEFSNKLQSIEIYTPRKDAGGKLIGIKQEVVLYDPEAFVEPLRIVQNLDKLGDLNEAIRFRSWNAFRRVSRSTATPRRCRPARRSSTPCRISSAGRGRRSGSAITRKAWSGRRSNVAGSVFDRRIFGGQPNDKTHQHEAPSRRGVRRGRLRVRRHRAGASLLCDV